ncbi:MAG: RluA family pseudouridine synthase [Chitinophagaceae bacterium]
MIAVNKPSGWLSIPDRHDEKIPSVRSWLEKMYPKILIIHRIDRDTSGLLLFAKNEAAHKYYNQLFEQRSVKKIYQGIAVGSVILDEGSIEQPIEQHPSVPGIMRIGRNGKPSVTHFKVIERLRGFTWLEFDLETGRTHQIRVHMKHLGHPLVCDAMYGSSDPILLSAFKKKFKLSKDIESEKPLLDRLALHASIIQMKGMDGNPIQIEAPPSKDLQVALMQLKKYAKR